MKTKTKKTPTREYKCEGCLRYFKSPTTFKEMYEEADKTFGAIEPQNEMLVCQDCYEKLMQNWETEQ